MAREASGETHQFTLYSIVRCLQGAVDDAMPLARGPFETRSGEPFRNVDDCGQVDRIR
jgi:hypothetical protein